MTKQNPGTHACLENSKILKIGPWEHEKFLFLSTTIWLRMGVKGDADLLMFSYSFSLSTRPK